MAAGLEELRARFVKAFAGVPARMREEIIALVADKPFNWNAAYVEVYGKTETGDEILGHLQGIGLLQE